MVPGAIRVFVVEERLLLRAALQSLLAQHADLIVVGTAGTERLDTPALARLKPDVVMVDIDTDAGLGRAAKLVWQARQATGPAVLMLIGQCTPRRLNRALAADPPGLIAKDTSAGTLVATIRRLGRGDTVIEPALALIAHRAARSPLTRRECDVLRLAADGASANEIGGRLLLAPGTVRNYLSSAIGKTHSRNRIGAITVARRAGWL